MRDGKSCHSWGHQLQYTAPTSSHQAEVELNSYQPEGGTRGGPSVRTAATSSDQQPLLGGNGDPAASSSSSSGQAASRAASARQGTFYGVAQLEVAGGVIPPSALSSSQLSKREEDPEDRGRFSERGGARSTTASAVEEDEGEGGEDGGDGEDEETGLVRTPFQTSLPRGSLKSQPAGRSDRRSD